MAGDVETGVTIHETVEELDAGPVAAQGRSRSARTTTPARSTRSAAEVAVALLDEVLESPAPASAPGGRGVTYADKIGAEDRLLDLSGPRTSSSASSARSQPAHRRARGAPGPARHRLAGSGRGGRRRSSPSRFSLTGGRPMEYDAWLRGLR